MLGQRLLRRPYVKSTFNPYPVYLLQFQPLEVVSRYRDPQPQVAENYSYFFMFDSSPNICKS